MRHLQNRPAVRPATVRPATRPATVHLATVRPATVRPATVHLATVRLATVRLATVLLAALAAALMTSCPKPKPADPTGTSTGTTAGGSGSAATPSGPATVAEAEAFMKEAEAELLKLWIDAERAAWVKATFITHDTGLMEAAAFERLMIHTAIRAKAARRYEGLAGLSPDMQRKLKLLKLSLSLPAPPDDALTAELAKISSGLDAAYGKGKYCPDKPGAKCMELGELSDVLAKSRKYDELLDVWTGWRTVSPPMRDDYTRFVELANMGSREMGFADTGEMWRSNYDMSPAEFETEVDRLFNDVKPLYEQMHCYARTRLGKKYGTDKVPADGPLPAHLMGNMWAQDWSNLRDLLMPKGGGAVDLTKILKAKKTDERGMVKYGEGFFVSLGLEALPDTFWERSMFTKPADRDVMCHASAWDIDYINDLRIKMCIKVNAEDFETIHHELGHNYYQYYYRKLDPLFRGSANDGFHEGLGDTISLSVTPKYMKELGLIKALPKDDMPVLMERAMAKVAFLPFGVLIDKWRWDVFSGKITPENYNAAWWALRLEYQGIAPPVERTEANFDPGAKYHIPGNVPYIRYFLATILQFQFHQALCEIAGHEGPLHTCSIYNNKEAGERLAAMMEMGMSKPWPDALEALTGKREMDAGALMAYFEPLHEWLKNENEGVKCGW